MKKNGFREGFLPGAKSGRAESADANKSTPVKQKNATDTGSRPGKRFS